MVKLLLIYTSKPMAIAVLAEIESKARERLEGYIGPWQEELYEHPDGDRWGVVWDLRTVARAAEKGVVLMTDEEMARLGDVTKLTFEEAEADGWFPAVEITVTPQPIPFKGIAPVGDDVGLTWENENGIAFDFPGPNAVSNWNTVFSN